MIRLHKLLLALALLLAVFVQGASAQLALDYGSMSNTASLFASATTASGNTLIPVTIGVILLCAGIGVWYRFSSKARIRS